MALTMIELLRRVINEPDDSVDYPDTDLAARLAETGATMNRVALAVWQEKMAAVSSLVNVSEGGSSRAMSQAFDHAKVMVELFTGLVETETAGPGTVLRRITRV